MARERHHKCFIKHPAILNSDVLHPKRGAFRPSYNKRCLTVLKIFQKFNQLVGVDVAKHGIGLVSIALLAQLRGNVCEKRFQTAGGIQLLKIVEVNSYDSAFNLVNQTSTRRAVLPFFESNKCFRKLNARGFIPWAFLFVVIGFPEPQSPT